MEYGEMGQVELSVVVPAFNEGRSIESALANLDDVFKREEWSYEIVVIDDGSSDNTLMKALLYARKNIHVRVLSSQDNNGKGYALKTGFMKSIGDLVIFADSDLEIEVDVASKYIEALNRGDIAIASKWHPESRVDISTSRRILSHCFNVLVKILINVNIRDTQTGLKAIRKSSFENIIPKLTVKRFAFDVELLAVANRYGLKIVEMPVQVKINAPPKFKEILEMFFDLLRITYRVRILRMYGKSASTFNYKLTSNINQGRAGNENSIL
jgi:glycosyltransferase involved in cell wall biosynthesis